MKQILQNLAHIDLLTFCKAQGIDPSGSYAVKNGRGFKYSLVRETDGKAFVTVTFHKHQTPTHYIHNY